MCLANNQPNSNFPAVEQSWNVSSFVLNQKLLPKFCHAGGCSNISQLPKEESFKWLQMITQEGHLLITDDHSITGEGLCIKFLKLCIPKCEIFKW